MDNLYLLIKHYQNECDEQEKRRVESWLSESEQNRKRYEEYIQVWQASERAKALQNVDVTADWKNVMQKATLPKPSKYKTLNFWTRVAAALILFFATYWFVQYKVLAPEYLLVKNEQRNQVKEVTLPDGTRVSLNYQSALEYPDRFAWRSRKVKLSGNAFFNVTKNKRKPFSIETNRSVVQVLGTSFDVQADQTKTIVTVATGKVRVKSKTMQNKYVDLLPNEQAIHQGETLEKKQVEIDNYLSWKTGTFRFQNHTLAEVMSILERRFHFDYRFSNEELRKRELTADFSGESLDDIIKIIQISCQVKINVESNQLIISKHE